MRGVRRQKQQALLDKFRPRSDLWKSLALRVLEENGSSEALSASIALRSDDHSSLLDAAWDPHQYGDARSARLSYQARELLRKFPGLNGSSQAVRVGAALRKGREAEELCRETNIRFRQAYISGRREFLPSFSVGTVLDRAQRKIKWVLDGGEERDCSFTVDSWLRHCSWGKGVSDTCRDGFTSSYNKFDARPSFTRQASRFAALLMERDATWRLHAVGEGQGACCPLITHSRGNRITTVPKTAQTDRLIAVEPHWNVYFQLGVGGMIRSRLLRRAQIDLTTQEINRNAAQLGSLRGEFATIDLSSASDTVAIEVVRHLLPPAWFQILDDLRSPESFWPDTKQWERINKFSSMGNGFTFELETLIFWALAQSAVELMGTDYKVPVYGDDIIVPTECFNLTVEVLTYCGFLVNKRKSYSTSYFRESCGMNAFSGGDITPVRLTDVSTLAHLFALINNLREKDYPKSARWLEQTIPRGLRLYGPLSLAKSLNLPSGGREEFGDAVIASEDISLWDYRLINGGNQYFFWGLSIPLLTFRPTKFRVKRLEPALLYSWTTTSREGGMSGQYAVRRVGKWEISSGTVLGPEAGLRRGELLPA